MRTSIFGGGFTLLALGTMALSALAAEPAKPAAVSSLVATARIAAPAADMVTKAAYVEGFGLSLTGAALAKLRGGVEVTENMTITGTVSNNSADQVVTGSNSISTDSFNGAVGVPMVIQNTGNNVLIQNATIINVQFQP